MDYKRFFRSRELRFRILRMLSFIPDSAMLKLQYRIKMGFRPDFKEPKRFTEKLQLYKMFYRNPALPRCVDKYEVRRYLEERGFGHLLNRLYGVYDRAEEIDFGSLPERFVVKTTDGSGGNNILICRDKSQLDIAAAVASINSWLGVKNVNAGREWAYTGIAQSRIIVEEFLENEADPEAGLEDYKFFCFDGKAYCVQIDIGRYKNHTRNIYDRNFRLMDVLCTYPNDKSYRFNVNDEAKRQLTTIAESLSEGFPFVRVDLYYASNRVFFGELTFYPGSGYEGYKPDEFDRELGRMFDISSFVKQ